MTPRDKLAAQRALIAWLNSQQIDPRDAALLLVNTAGQLIGLMSMNDPGARSQALEILAVEMVKNSHVLDD